MWREWNLTLTEAEFHIISFFKKKKRQKLGAIILLAQLLYRHFHYKRLQTIINLGSNGLSMSDMYLIGALQLSLQHNATWCFRWCTNNNCTSRPYFIHIHIYIHYTRTSCKAMKRKCTHITYFPAGYTILLILQKVHHSEKEYRHDCL